VEDASPIDLGRVERILAPLCADPSRLGVTFEGPDGRFLAGSSSGPEVHLPPRVVREVRVDEALIGRLVARGPGAEAPGIAGILDSLAVALGTLIEEARWRRALEEGIASTADSAHPVLDAEFAQGRLQQRRIVSLRAPEVPGFELASHYEAARDIGGDFFEFFRIRRRSRPLGVVIADVTGKGIAAALLMAFSRPLIHGAMDLASGPADALERTNRILVAEGRSTLFITASLAAIDVRTGTLRLANAGHEPPLLVPGNGSPVRPLGEAGPLLGAFSRLGLAESTDALDPGDLVLFYTDGVTDAQAPSGERFDDDRLLETIEAARGASANDLVGAIREAVDGFRAGVEPPDDVTIVAIRRLGR
jgi:sigma-B regulation protein RsbU (phosphoserine phosphatase)